MMAPLTMREAAVQSLLSQKGSIPNGTSTGDVEQEIRSLLDTIITRRTPTRRVRFADDDDDDDDGTSDGASDGSSDPLHFEERYLANGAVRLPFLTKQSGALAPFQPALFAFVDKLQESLFREAYFPGGVWDTVLPPNPINMAFLNQRLHVMLHVSRLGKTVRELGRCFVDMKQGFLDMDEMLGTYLDAVAAGGARFTFRDRVVASEEISPETLRAVISDELCRAGLLIATATHRIRLVREAMTGMRAGLKNREQSMISAAHELLFEISTQTNILRDHVSGAVDRLAFENPRVFLRNPDGAISDDSVAVPPLRTLFASVGETFVRSGLAVEMMLARRPGN